MSSSTRWPSAAEFGSAGAASKPRRGAIFGRPAGGADAAAGRAARGVIGEHWTSIRGATRRRRRQRATACSQQMRDNGAIDEARLEAADRQPLALAAPPADHKPCVD